MSVSMSGEPKVQEANNTERIMYSRKCKIPQRLPPGRLRSYGKPRSQLTEKNRADISNPQPRFGLINPRSRIIEKPYQPLSKKDLVVKMPLNNASKVGGGKPDIITVPLQEESAKQVENLFEARADFGKIFHTDMLIDLNESDSMGSRKDKILRLRMNRKEEKAQLENTTNEIMNRQGTINKFYNSSQNTPRNVQGFDQSKSVPHLGDVCKMTVEDMTPSQLLMLCADMNTSLKPEVLDESKLSKKYLSFDVAKLKEMPSKLVETCEHAISKTQELIDWFDNLKNQEKECSKSMLTRKINEFNAQNQMLSSNLQCLKSEFLKDLEEKTDFLRNFMKQAIVITMTNENLKSQISLLNSPNSVLRKQIYSTEKSKPHHNRGKFEELEKELRDEKFKTLAAKDKLSRAECQLRIGEERASRLEAALEQSRLKIRPLERTVQKLTDQNQRLQRDFDEELTKLKESISNNTTHLEEIADAREKLQAEKMDLEKRLEELSNHYNESMNNMKQEFNTNLAKVIESEKRYNEEVEEKIKLQKTVEAQCAKLLEAELRYKDLLQHSQDIELKLNAAINENNEINKSKEIELENVKADLEKQAKLIVDLNNGIDEIKNKLDETRKAEEQLRSEIDCKNKYIEDLKYKEMFLVKKIQDSDSKMQSYEEQLSTIKKHIKKLQDHYGQFENFEQLHDLINFKNNKMLEISQQNQEISELLKMKLEEIENYKKTITEQEHVINERNDIIHVLSEKDEEQTNIIKLLRNNLEIRAKADSGANQQLNEKEIEINSLLANVEARKQQIYQLEKIILALDEQKRDDNIQRNKDQEKINTLEKKIVELEQHIQNKNNDKTFENLDKLIKIFEAEMESKIEPSAKREKNKSLNKSYLYDNNQDYPREIESRKHPKNSVPTKIVLGNFVKKTYIANSEEKPKDLPDQKRALTNIEAKTWIPSQSDMFVCNQIIKSDHDFTLLQNIDLDKSFQDSRCKNMAYTGVGNKAFCDKKCKMFQIASHRL